MDWLLLIAAVLIIILCVIRLKHLERSEWLEGEDQKYLDLRERNKKRVQDAIINHLCKGKK